MITATIQLTNRWPQRSERHDLVDNFEVRQLQVPMLVDTGSYYMCINEYVFECLSLTVLYKKDLVLANGTIACFDVAGPIEARFENRVCMTDAIVLPGNSECLLGAIPMESMDVVVNPKRQELTVNPDHPDFAVYRL